MQLFDLLNYQYVVLFFYPTLVFIILFGLYLGYVHFAGGDAERRKSEITYHFPQGIGDRRSPFPLALALTIAGVVLWMFFYILGVGLTGVKI